MEKRTLGIILSYILIIIDIVVGILFVPILLNSLGDEEYGLYKLLLSTASYLAVLDFGIGGTITRYVVKFRTEKDDKKAQNFLAMGFIIYLFLALLILVIATVICILLPNIYAKSIPATKIGHARIIFMFLCSSTAISLFNHAYNGLTLAYEKYSYTKSMNITKILLRVLLIIILLQFSQSVMVVVLVDFGLTVLLLLVNIFYTRFNLNCKIKLYKWDTSLAKEAFLFTTAILLQSIINQFNTNLDNIVLGIYTTTSIVAIYSIALQIYSMFSSLSTAISSMYLPSISKAVFNGSSDDEITDMVVDPSRMQLIILLLAFSGFILFGKNFISLWVGKDYMEVYLLCLILLGSSILDLSQNSITSVLKAKNILHGKTLILLVSTIINACITFILVPRIGMIGAAIGTAFSMIVGYGLALGIYYHKVAKVNMFRYYKKTYKGILLATLLSFCFGIGITLLIPWTTWWGFVIKAIIYVVIYCVVFIIVGLNKNEKNKLFSIFSKNIKE